MMEKDNLICFHIFHLLYTLNILTYDLAFEKHPDLFHDSISLRWSILYLHFWIWLGLHEWEENVFATIMTLTLSQVYLWIGTIKAMEIFWSWRCLVWTKGMFLKLFRLGHEKVTFGTQIIHVTHLYNADCKQYYRKTNISQVKS